MLCKIAAKRALEFSTNRLILVQNHLSGDPTPSRADIDMTKVIIDAAKALDITVHDPSSSAGWPCQP
ncbi:hypothetical protein HLI18_15945 [Rhizobium laguerreae]|nr:hypothetical protein [Rhizobium laguerreae]